MTNEDTANGATPTFPENNMRAWTRYVASQSDEELDQWWYQLVSDERLTEEARQGLLEVISEELQDRAAYRG